MINKWRARPNGIGRAPNYVALVYLEAQTEVEIDGLSTKFDTVGGSTSTHIRTDLVDLTRSEWTPVRTRMPGWTCVGSFGGVDFLQVKVNPKLGGYANAKPA